MNNIINFEEYLLFNKIKDLNEDELDNINNKILSLFEDDNIYELDNIFEGEKIEALKDVFKRNPEEGTFKKLVKYFLFSTATSWAGGAVGAGIGKLAGGGNKVQAGIKIFSFLGTALGILGLALYRRETDNCDAKRNKANPDKWYDCKKNAAEKTIIKIKSSSIEAINAAKKRNDDKAVEKIIKSRDEIINRMEDVINKCKNKADINEI